MSFLDLNVGLILCVIGLFLWISKLSDDIKELKRFIYKKGYETGLRACSDSTTREVEE